MEVQSFGASGTLVRASLQLGLETYTIVAGKGSTLSEQLASMKEETMSLFRDYITKYNVPTDVPDDLVESSSEDDDEAMEKPHVKSKKTKIN